MATEQSATVPSTGTESATWASWLAALVGLWALVSPFVVSGSIGTGTPMWSTAIAGFVILVLGAFSAYGIRSEAEAAPNSVGEWSGWIAALAGLWLLISPFVLSGPIGSGTAMYSTVVGGVVALVFGAYAGYSVRESH